MKKLIVPISLLLIGAIFIVASLMVYFSKGKMSKWVSLKMKFGALLLTLTAIISGCSKKSIVDPPEITCYMIAAEWVQLEGAQNDTLTISSINNQVIKGEVALRTSENFVWKLSSKTDTLIAKKPLIPNDGKFDASTEKFSITLSPKLIQGEYLFQIFRTNDEYEYEIYRCVIKVD